MDITRVNQILSEMRDRLSSLDEQKQPEQHNPTKLSGAQKRLKNLYAKQMAGRDESTKVQSTGAQR